MGYVLWVPVGPSLLKEVHPDQEQSVLQSVPTGRKGWRGLHWFYFLLP